MDPIIVRLRAINIYQAKRLILEKVNLDLNRGEFAYLIGKTGSGKSSLLKTLYGALPVDGGQARVAGHDLVELNRKTLPLLRRDLGIVFQDFNLLEDRSVYNNLDFVLQATDWVNKVQRQQRIREVLDAVDLWSARDKMPHTLSGGEQQRVVIARALLNKPQLIIADEPTGNLDPETADEILLLLRRLAQERHTAVLFATHDYRILEHFPARIIRIIDQKVVEEQELRL